MPAIVMERPSDEPASRVLVWGGGGHGRVLAEVVRLSGLSLAGFADADPAKRGEAAEPGGARVIAAETELLAALGEGRELPGNADVVAFGIGDNARRLSALRRSGARAAAPLVHPRAVVSGSARLETGTVVFAGAVLNAAVRAGAAVIVNTSAVVEHDCVLADGVHISPGAVLGGGVRVGRGTWIGAGATVIHGISIGESAIVGAGAVIIHDVPDGVTVVGNPGRILPPAHHRKT